MSQLSRPYQVALAALLLLALAWFTVLKPSDAGTDAAPLPGEVGAAPAAAPVTSVPGAAGLGSAVDKAKAAAAIPPPATADGAQPPAGSAGPAAAGAAAGASTPAAATPPTGTPPATAAASEDLSAPIIAAVDKGRVAVVLFFEREGADDRAVRRALRRADRHGGRVLVRAVPISRVARYGAITQGVSVLQAPTILVIGPGRKARTLVGFTDTRAIDQLVSDVGGPKFVSEKLTGYDAKIGQLCTIIFSSFVGDAFNGSDVDERVDIITADFRDAARDSRRLSVPKRYRTFHRRWLAFLRDYGRGLAPLGAAVKRGDVAGGIATFSRAIADTEAALDRAGRRAKVTCG